MATSKDALRRLRLAERGACGIRQARHDFSRDRLRLDLPRMIRIGCGPYPFFEPLHREFAGDPVLPGGLSWHDFVPAPDDHLA